MFAAHRHTQQWEHIWMTEAFPRYHLFAEPLRNHNQTRRRQSLWIAYLCNLGKVTCRVYLQNLDGNVATLMFAHPHVGIPATADGFTRSVITKRDV